MQNDFAARADWCVEPFSEANHPPVVSVVGPLDRTARPGETVKLAATATDPDADKLTYKWWHYREAGICDGTVEIVGSANAEASFTVPATATNGQTLHLICEVTDDGAPALTRYQRVIVTVH